MPATHSRSPARPSSNVAVPIGANFVRTGGELEMDLQHLQEHIATVISQFNATFTTARIQVLPHNGRQDTDYISMQLRADVIPSLGLLERMLSTGKYKVMLRYNCMTVNGSPQLMVDCSRHALPIKQKTSETKRSYVLNFLLLSAMAFLVVYGYTHEARP